MALSEKLISILVCPEDKSPLSLADSTTTARLNERIANESLSNRGGRKVVEPIQTGLIRKDGRYLYPVRDDIPVMLLEEAIPLDQLKE